MHKQLIIAAFEKAKASAEKGGIKKPSKSQIAGILSEYFTEEVGFSFSNRRLRDYYNDAIALINTTGDINIAQQNVINGLCKYVGYESFQFFLNAQTLTSKKDTRIVDNSPNEINTPSFLKKHKAVIFLVLTTMAVVVIIIKINQQRWMVWNGEAYKAAAYNSKRLQDGSLKLYNKERIENFRKLKYVGCKTEFFNADGSVKVWYGKNRSGDLECFSSYGLHPETGKTLKPITYYIINKYLCNNTKQPTQ